MMRAAQSDGPVSAEQEAAAPEGASAEGLRSLQEKLETAFAAPDELPPHILQTPFNTGTQRQAAAFGDLHTRLEQLENSEELADLRETMRQMCSAISGLALEAERGAGERDEKIETLAQSLQSQVQADRERLDALEIRVVNSEASNARSFDEAQAAMRRLEEHLQAGDAQNDDLAYNMRMLRGELASLNEIAAVVRELEERIASGDSRHEDLVRHAGALRDELKGVGAAAATAMRQLEDRLRLTDARHDDLARDMTRLKGDVVNETAVAMHEHQSQMHQAERAIGELKDRNTRSAERIEALTETLGSVGRKVDNGTVRLATLSGDLGKLGRRLDSEVNGAELLAERLGTVEKWLAKSQERERTQAELHARLANSMLRPSED
jgi:chromosome segregation ATPase